MYCLKKRIDHYSLERFIRVSGVRLVSLKSLKISKQMRPDNTIYDKSFLNFNFA